MADIYISYSHKDQGFVRALHNALEAHERGTWIDWRDISLTANWLEEVRSGIESANAFIFVVSPDSVVSEHCRMQLEHAVKNNKRIVPIWYRDVDDVAVPPDVATHQYIWFRDHDDFDKSFEHLLEALDTDLEWVRAHTRLLARAKEWESEGQDGSFLLRGKDLEAAERWQAQEVYKEPKLTLLQKEYINASRRAATRFKRTTLGLYATIALLLATNVFTLATSDQSLTGLSLILSVLVGAVIGGVGGHAIGYNRVPE